MKRSLLCFAVAILAVLAPIHRVIGGEPAMTFSKPLAGPESPPLRPIEPGSLKLTRPEIDQLLLPRRGASINLPGIDRFTGNEDDPLQFRQIALFAAGAHIRVFADGQESEQAPPGRDYYLAGNATTGIGLAVNPATGQVTGFAYKAGSRVGIEGGLISGLEFRAVEEPPGGVNSCGNDAFGLGAPTAPAGTDSHAMSLSAAQAGETVSYQAVVAVDTDSEWLDGFGDDTLSAATWIADLFLAMNVFFQRDVETQFLIGQVTLRTGSDPYSVPSDRLAQLNEFGKYWKDNMAHVERQFATMFSGRAINAWSFSGIAWLDQYCAYGRSWGSSTYGSYSYNAIGSSRSPANTAIYVGHELGHNMGSPHTHCYDPPVDECYNAESGCFNGSPACPSGGKGTIMSYCHVGGSSGAGCGTSKSEFHPVVQGLLQDRLADEAARGCILPYTEPAAEDTIFESGFED